MPEINVLPTDEDAVLKEVWGIDNIDVKTELSDEQIKNVNKVKMLGIVLNNKFLIAYVDKFMQLQKSRNRKSMDEFVKVMRAKREDFVDKGRTFMSSMMG